VVPMRKVVRDTFWDFNVPMEGFCTWMYPDVKGLISTGVGNLIDPYQYAKALPWKRPDGSLAPKLEIEQEWNRLKAMDKKVWQYGGGWFKNHTTLRLTEADVRKLVESKADQMAAHLKMRFKDWDTYPADAQLGMMSMAWGLGPAFNYPKFQAHLKLREWEGCALECGMQEKGNPGVIPRNQKNRILFRNAAMVEKLSLDPDKLYFPAELGKPCPTCGK
jgi:hypothetical protein